MSRWRPGDTVLLRYFKRGRPAGALPTRLISTEGPVLWLASGTPVMWPAIDGRPVREMPPEDRQPVRSEAVERPWTGDGVLIVGRPGRAHAIWLFWDAGRFAGWYVNLEDPWRPSRLGFDTEDHELDLWIASDGSWRWKDEHDLEVGVERGYFTREQATAFRVEGERVLAEWPFPTGWEQWQADPSWAVPGVPADWDT